MLPAHAGQPASGDVTLANLVCLVRALKKEHLSDLGLTILIFDSRYR
jgi:hypothetical protein